jgi:branched-chain amino acid transport system ATP-binding protein
MSESLLEARGLHTYYGASHILHGVDFRIGAGQTVGLMGRNGMGKSTLIRSMLGLVKPRDGEVRVRGSVMTGADAFRVARQGIAYVPEGRGIFPNLTVRENLVMAARAGPDGRRDWTYERALATFPRLAERTRPRRRAALGRRAADADHRPGAHDQSRSLDPRRSHRGLGATDREEIWRIVGDIRAHGIATLIVDKNYRAVTAIADRNVILVKGRIVFEGASGELLAQPDVLHRHLGV